MAQRGGVRARTADDPVLDDRVRHLANMPGRYYLEKWRSSTDRQVSSFACRIQRISPMSMILAAPVGGDVGDWVTAHFDEFGVLRGQISRPLGFGFGVSLRMNTTDRERLAAQVLWCERHKNFEVSDQRRHRRIFPKSPQSTLVLADGTAMDCFVINMSASGAAVSADIVVEIGMPLALGTVVARVVRLLNPGFAVEFVELIELDQLEHRVIRQRDALCA